MLKVASQFSLNFNVVQAAKHKKYTTLLNETPFFY